MVNGLGLNHGQIEFPNNFTTQYILTLMRQGFYVCHAIKIRKSPEI